MNDYLKKDGIVYLSDPRKNPFDVSEYIRVRTAEGRVYSDAEVSTLPDISPAHKLKKEWDIRKKTAINLITYFSKYNGRNILEIGCGNGWLSNQIAMKTANNLTALDLNELELKQAARVFGENKKLRIVFGDIFENIFHPKEFEFIFLAGSAQYFSDFNGLIRRLLYYLSPGGEIHIVDSHFYKKAEVNDAKERSRQYYLSTGHPEMIKSYFHHTYEDLKTCNYFIKNSIILNLNRLLISTKILSSITFPWIIIRNDDF